MKIFSLFLLVSISVWSCIPCETINVDLPPIPDSIVEIINYEDKDILILEHSAGKQIELNINQAFTQERTHCSHCCDTYTYQLFETKFTPNYPSFSINIQISSLDSTYRIIGMNIGSSNCNIPIVFDLDNQLFTNMELKENELINNVNYDEVFKIKMSSWKDDPNIISPDSLYYNHEIGILKIIMNNEETYTLSN